MVGKIILYAMEEGKELDQLKLEEMKNFSGEIDTDVHDWLDPALCIKRRELPGGTGPGMVRKRLDAAKREIDS
jgi:argininosuccinate lyase